MDNLTQSPELRQCARGEKCKHKDGPLLPVAEFYRHTNNKYYNSYCKECCKENSRTQKRPPKKQSGEQTEQTAIKKLRSLGIYAVSGKASEFTHVDVVAWGCVRIEVKAADKKDDGTWNFAFSSQRNKGIKADFVLLMQRDKDQIAYHLFPVGHPIFFKNGKVKAAVQYIPFAHHRKPGIYLSTAIMNEHKDA